MKTCTLLLALLLTAGYRSVGQPAFGTGSTGMGIGQLRPASARQLQLTVGGALWDGHWPDGNAFTRVFAEVGLQQLRADGMCFPVTRAQGLALEVSPGRQMVYGLRYGGWISLAIIGVGLHGVYYTNFQQGDFRIRPELLFGGAGGRLALGYDIPAYRNNSFEAVRDSRAHISLTIHLAVRKTQTDGFTEASF